MNHEIFVYVGLTSNVHFFLHTVVGDFSNTAVEKMCGDVYNCMIHETMIQQNQKVAVFNILKNKEWFVCLVDHITFPHINNPNIEDLKTCFFRLLNAERSASGSVMSIHYDGTKYLLYKIPGKLPTYKGLNDSSQMEKLSLQYSNKMIMYL